LIPGRSTDPRWKIGVFALSIAGAVLGLIPMILSVAGVYRCRVACLGSQSLPAQNKDASFWPLPVAAALAEVVTTCLVGFFVVHKGAKVAVLQFVHFLVIPVAVVAALFTDGVIISVGSYALGYQSTLFCPISGCQVFCSFDCPSCNVNLGDCTLIQMRVLIFFFVVFRAITAALNIYLWKVGQESKAT
jgi:hypothetical protein